MLPISWERANLIRQLHQPTILWVRFLYLFSFINPPFLVLLFPGFLPPFSFDKKEKVGEREREKEKSADEWINKGKRYFGGPQLKAMSISGDNTHTTPTKGGPWCYILLSLSCVSGLRRSLGPWRTDKVSRESPNNNLPASHAERDACAFLQLVCSHNRRCLFHLGPDDHLLSRNIF